jgi:hypothetical protein
MTYRRIEFSALPTWSNPLKSVEHKPFLGDIAFPVHTLDCHGAMPSHPYSVLRRFYVNQRADGPIDVSGLKHFLYKKPSGIYVIKGDVGAGKTWFLRYLLRFAVPEEFEIRVKSGVIDMWHQKLPTPLENAHWQLDGILTEIVDKPIGLRTALEEEAHRFARTAVGGSPDTRPYKEQFDAYFRQVQDPSQRVERNLLRLAYLERERIPIVIGVDNIDRYSDEEQSRLFGMMVKLLRYSNIRLIVPVRPSSYFATRRCFDAGEFGYDDMEMQKLDYAAMLRARFAASIDGVSLQEQSVVLHRSDFDARRDDVDSESQAKSRTGDSEQVITNFPQILEIFLRGYGFTLLDQLADTDVRQALKLVKRVFFSDNLLAISNLEIGYHFVSSAMLRRSRDFLPDESYILNLFDDDHPDRPGNSLVRFRVLEYFINGNRRIGDDSFFSKYFARYGYDRNWVCSVLRLFVESGLLRSADGREGTLEGVDELVSTRQGRLYFFTLVKNKWYLYCIKRGMAIDEVYITRKYVRPHVRREEVEDDQLMQFFIQEEELEDSRIKQWADDTGEDETKFGKGIAISDVVRETLGLQS